MKYENGKRVDDGGRNPAPGKKYARGYWVDEEYLRLHKKEIEDKLKRASEDVLFPFDAEDTEGPVFASICHIAAVFMLPDEKGPCRDLLPSEPPLSRQAEYLESLEQQINKLAMSLEDTPYKVRAHLLDSVRLGGENLGDLIKHVTSDLWTLRGYLLRACSAIKSEPKDDGGRQEKAARNRFIKDLVAVYSDHAADPVAIDERDGFVASVFEALGVPVPGRLRRIISKLSET